jgi:acid phosphatase (class A)
MTTIPLLKKTTSGLLFCALLSLSVFAAPEAGRFLRSKDVDVTTLIPPAPADNSLNTAADIEVVYQVQRRRTPEQVTIALYFADDSIFQFDAVLGSWFKAETLPLTTAFFAQIDEDRGAITSKGKKLWSRPRPPLLDSRIHACVFLPKSGSYPSGHSTRAFVFAGLLSEVFPEKREALRERAQLVAWSRVIGGVHYPSDIVAGRMLADRLVEEFLKVPAVRDELEKVKTELLAQQKKNSLAEPAAPVPGH